MSDSRSKPSSATPSQSSSKLLQTSTVVSVVSVQTAWPVDESQASVPSTQASPSKPSQGVPTPGKFSSTIMSQSSSAPLHSSPVVEVVSLQVTEPSGAQTTMPSMQASPSAPSQTLPSSGKASSTRLSQSSSKPLQRS